MKTNCLIFNNKPYCIYRTLGHMTSYRKVKLKDSGNKMVSSLLYYISFVTFVGSTVWTLLVYKLLCIKPTPRKYDKCVDKCTIIYTTKASGWSLITHPDQTPRTCVWCILQFNVFYFGIRLYSKNIVLPPLEFINFDKVEYFCNFDPQKMFILKLYFHILVLLLNIFWY